MISTYGMATGTSCAVSGRASGPCVALRPAQWGGAGQPTWTAPRMRPSLRARRIGGYGRLGAAKRISTRHNR